MPSIPRSPESRRGAELPHASAKVSSFTDVMHGGMRWLNHSWRLHRPCEQINAGEITRVAQDGIDVRASPTGAWPEARRDLLPAKPLLRVRHEIERRRRLRNGICAHVSPRTASASHLRSPKSPQAADSGLREGIRCSISTSKE